MGAMRGAVSDGILAPREQDGSAGRVAPAQASEGCPHCTGKSTSYAFVYAPGRIEPRFPTIGVEKEFAQVVSRADGKGKTDRELLHSVISARENRYLARQLCWVLTVQGIETYLLRPRDPGDIELLVEALRSSPHPGDLDVVIGVRGPVAPPEL